jgi:hypothetical protein
MITIEQIEGAKKNLDYPQWIVNTFEHLEANNNELLSYIREHKDKIIGPEKVDPSLIVRTVGSESNILNHESEAEFQEVINRIAGVIQEPKADQIVFLCEKFNGKYYLLDGNHTFEAVKKYYSGFIWVLFIEDRIIHDLMHK